MEWTRELRKALKPLSENMRAHDEPYRPTRRETETMKRHFTDPWAREA
jgi:hypothetical protein